MAGSIKWTYYVTDDGQEWGLLRDESNLEGVLSNDAVGDIIDGSNVRYSVPRNVQPRFATYKSTSTVRTRKVTIPTRELFDNLTSTNPTLSSFREFTDSTGEVFRLQSVSPERIRPVIFSEDTGLNDGDATQMLAWMQWLIPSLVPIVIYIYRLDKRMDALEFQIASMRREILDRLIAK